MDLHLTFLQIFSCDFAILVGVRDWFQYKDGKRDNRKGSIYNLLRLNAACDQISVKIEDEYPVVTQEELDRHNIAMDFVLCQMEGFEAKPYADRTGKLALSAKAEQIIIKKEKKL